jgi:hypothetical protein
LEQARHQVGAGSEQRQEAGTVDEIREHVEFDPQTGTVAGGDVGAAATPGDHIRALVAEAGVRGAPMVSSQAMQARLFRIYDAVSASAEALALVQRHLGLTLDRTWYSAEEIDGLADELDRLMGLVAVDAELEAAEAGADDVAEVATAD